jgi:hypothetical protein
LKLDSSLAPKESGPVGNGKFEVKAGAPEPDRNEARDAAIPRYGATPPFGFSREAEARPDTRYNIRIC